MKILISPSRKMELPEVDPYCQKSGSSIPLLEPKADEIRSLLMNKTETELLDLYKCSSKVLKPAYEQLCLNRQGICEKGSALLCYRGLAFSSMAPHVFNDDEWNYVQKHLRILSGMYGILKPEDQIAPYRLEMKTKMPFSLYDYWRKPVSAALQSELEEQEEIINLASREYSRLLADNFSLITIHFYDEDENGKRREPGANAKKARGTMVRWMAENKIECSEDLKNFAELGYQYDREASGKDRIVFVRKNS